jgi:hypothetical protein
MENKKYSENNDSYYDEQTNEWLEDICDDPDCDLCVGRTPTPMTDIFVFGSNLAGRHGAGAAKFALENHGAIYGQGIGLQGQSYGIPTKDENIQTLPLHRIQEYVQEFLSFASSRPDLYFNVTAVGCGLAGYTPDQIAPFFLKYPKNVKLPMEFRDVIYAPLRKT